MQKLTLHLSQTRALELQGIEKLSLVPYKDGIGYSIGFGHHIVMPKEARYMHGINEAQAKWIFHCDVISFERALLRLTPTYQWSQNEFDATIMCLYNVGLTALYYHTDFFSLLKAGNKLAAANEFLKLDKGNAFIHTLRVNQRELFLK